MVECDFCGLEAKFWIGTMARTRKTHARTCRRHLHWAVEDISECTRNAVRVEVLW